MSLSFPFSIVSFLYGQYDLASLPCIKFLFFVLKILMKHLPIMSSVHDCLYTPVWNYTYLASSFMGILVPFSRCFLYISLYYPISFSLPLSLSLSLSPCLAHPLLSSPQEGYGCSIRRFKSCYCCGLRPLQAGRRQLIQTPNGRKREKRAVCLLGVVGESCLEP